MSIHHRIFCRSRKWRNKLRGEIVPWLLAEADLGDCALEIGPGPGLGTEALLAHTSSIVALERDPGLLAVLQSRLTGTGVHVIAGDAVNMPFRACRFTSVVAIMVLHHIWPDAARQRAIGEAFRVLRPGGVFIGVDAKPEALKSRFIHLGDTILPVGIESLLKDLDAAGFTEIRIDQGSKKFRFLATRPPSAGSGSR
jgi:SAM-dependent methyltransferase